MVNGLNKLKFPRLFKMTVNTKLYDEREDQSPQNSKVSLVAEALPSLIYRPPLSENLTLEKIIVSHQNDNLSLMFLLLTKILILTGPKIQWHN